MRVIAGRHGGRRLRAPAGRGTRPTSDRVREAIFAILGDICGAEVLDVFAGSGALGIEALSRGARAAVFIERDHRALRVLRENLSALGIDEPAARLRGGEALAVLGAAQRAGETYDLIFIDPPYSQSRRWGPELSAILPQLLAPGGRVVVESDRRSPLVVDMQTDTERLYGDTSITIHSKR
jgi:16S rRNA (guanine(966)-N(2))-methyltransferase RsmD